MKKISTLLMLMVTAFLLVSCTVKTSDIPTLINVSPVPTLVTSVEPTFATPTQIPTEPLFSNAQFAVSPDNKTGQLSFPVRTKEIFAIWDYQNMREGLIVRREWYLDGKLWLEREEPWDFSKYGENGTISDISIYDYDNGLKPGVYQLRLYIDSVSQPIGSSVKSPVETWINFEVQPDQSISKIASPNEQWMAEILGGQKLIIRDSNGSPREVFSGHHEIFLVVWHPDNTHIYLIDRDRIQQQAGTNIGIRDDLWVVDILSGKSNLLYQGNTALSRSLVISPDGYSLASIEGSGFGDACFVDTRLIFFEVAGDFQMAKVVRQAEFANIPVIPDSIVYPVQTGVWQNNTQYKITLNVTCSTDSTLSGDYLFDLPSLKAEKAEQ